MPISRYYRREFKILSAVALPPVNNRASALYSIYSEACTCSALSKSCEEKQRRARAEVRGSWPHRNIWRHPIRIFGTATRHFHFSASSRVLSPPSVPSSSAFPRSFLDFPPRGPQKGTSRAGFSADSTKFRPSRRFPSFLHLRFARQVLKNT